MRLKRRWLARDEHSDLPAGSEKGCALWLSLGVVLVCAYPFALALNDRSYKPLLYSCALTSVYGAGVLWYARFLSLPSRDRMGAFAETVLCFVIPAALFLYGGPLLAAIF